MSTAVKPQLRNLLQTQIKRNLIIGSIWGVVAGAVFYFTVYEPKKRVYLEFNKNYDADAEFERIRATGVLQTCPPDE